jgi:signal peptidase I
MNILAKGNSMFPTLKDGELYNLVLLENGNVDTGDIIVYCVNDIIICHRIINIIQSKDNTLFLVTKGDNCAESDPYAVTLDKVIGKIII